MGSMTMPHVIGHGDPIAWLFNSHEWYTLATAGDHWRAWLWCVANAIVAFSYFVIPYRLYLSRVRQPFAVKNLSGTLLYISFIISCGSGHAMMLIVMPTAPWWYVLWSACPTALVSLMTACTRDSSK